MTAPTHSAAPEIKAQLNAHCHVAIDARGVATLTMCNAGPLIIFGAALLLISTKRWVPSRVEGAIGVLAFAAYMWANSKLATK